MSLKLINLGLPKSGTSTLARALRRAGWSCADHRMQSDGHAKAYVGKLIYDGLYDLGDPAALLTGYDSISEMSAMRDGLTLWPQTDFAVIDAFRRLHPDLKFVATRRESFAISQSMLGWSNLGDRLAAASIPGLPAGYGETTKARTAWIDGHYAHLRAIFTGSDRFLELDMGADDARAQLSAFIGRDLPWWGRRNANPLTHPAES